MTIIDKKNIFMNLNCADLVQPKNNINLTYLEIATVAVAGIRHFLADFLKYLKINIDVFSELNIFRKRRITVMSSGHFRSWVPV